MGRININVAWFRTILARVATLKLLRGLSELYTSCTTTLILNNLAPIKEAILSAHVSVFGICERGGVLVGLLA